ncbi:uncharacterized protein BCR38DRAFT_439326 [Pseudomassariella vexata]|uniref:Uncharacterized protein n=1 Tax=Pseudomassariella vexata TaxID=1141098 RepID=A0A1Y2DTL3_9PEZI|nr:uncharacterized protein BCR38DRAFT_439326 [Pseudomassariella vexata]ORY62632.1 hypothetical protein BCR38DRAFT_439326 [Pseudomassariella vexata]
MDTNSYSPQLTPSPASKRATPSPFPSITLPYPGAILPTLGLTPAMRIEFMVYWLLSLRYIRDRGQHINFMFVPQAALLKAAELKVEGGPVPSIVARVFMLFAGVEPEED